MSTLWLDEADASHANPLDLVEQVLADREWSYDRPETQEIVADIAGTWCHYQAWLNWQESYGALCFSCAMDAKIPEKVLPKIYPLLAKINEIMWLGHFDLSAQTRQITFRYSMLLKGVSGASLQQVEDLLDIAVTECEKFYPAFQALVWGDKSAEQVLEMVLMETVGEA